LKTRTLTYPRSLAVNIIGLIAALIMDANLLPDLYHDLSYQLRVAFQFVNAPATVVQCQSYPEGVMDFVLSYPLQDGSGTVVQGAAFVDTGSRNNHGCDNFAPGTALAVKYQPDQPQHAEVVDSRAQMPWPKALLDNGALWVLALFLLIGTGSVLYEVIRLLIKARRCYVLRRNGILLTGNVMACEHLTKFGKARLILNVTYKFLTPLGVELIDKQTGCRDDLKGKELPTLETPVAVLYVNERLYCLL